MPGFQRFVSYIHQYENDTKVRNVGFAKVEQRKEQCKIEIHMKGLGRTGVCCPVYLLADKKHGIQIGSITLANGTADGRYLIEKENINGSGYSWKQVSGFCVIVDETWMYASQWEEGELHRSELRLSELEGKAQTEGQVRSGEDLLPRNSQKEPQDLPPKGESDSHKEKTVESIAKGDPDIECSAMDVNSDREQEPRLQAQSVALQPVSPPVEPRLIRSLPEEAKEDGNINVQESWLKRWKLMREQYPVITPFEESPNFSALKIQLKDLRLLPRRCWYLGNNSFLLHGFFNYHHLIIGEIEKEGKRRWILGVPGVFQNQEKVMATIFGFSEFKQQKKAPHKTGQFGYWYRFI